MPSKMQSFFNARHLPRWVLTGVLALALLPLFTVCGRAADVASISAWTTGTTGPSRFTAGTDRLLIFTASMEAGLDRTITSVTYGGRAMTQVITRIAGTGPYERAYIFYLRQADIALATSNIFSVTWSGVTDEVRYAARMYQYVNQTTPIRDSDSNSTNSATPNPIVTPAMTVVDGDMVVAAAVCGNATSYAWNNSFIEGTDQAGITSQLSTAQRAVTSNGTMTASATNAGPNRQVILGSVLRTNTVQPPTTYYVRTDGSDSNTGTGSGTGSAWRTITKAVRDSPALPGDIIYVRSGTYNERIYPNIDGTSALPIRVIADIDGQRFGGSGGPVIVQAPSGFQAMELNGDDYFHFVGFNFRGVGMTNTVSVITSTGIYLTRCEITLGGYGVELQGIGSSMILINCLIHGVSNDAIHIFDGTAFILNTTIANNGADGIEQDAGSATIANSIIANHPDDGLDRNAGTMTRGYNLLYGNTTNFEGTVATTGEFIQNPRFADAAAGNYRLQSNSPAINVGTNLQGTVDNDLDGIDRPIGSGWDLGCHEFPLLGKWTFSEGSGSIVVDESGNGNDGTLQGTIAWETARCGFNLAFNGTSSWIDLGQYDLGTKSYTMCGWFKTSAAVQQTIFAATATGTSNHAFFVELNDQGHVLFVHRSPAASSGGSTLTSGDTYRDGRWHHVAVVKSTSKLQLYVDGELVGQVNDTSSVHSSVDIAVGRASASQSQTYFAGSLDEIVLYGSSLSASEIADLLGLVGRWQLDDASGTIAVDSSPLGNHGTYRNGVVLGGGGPINGLVAADFDGYNDYVELPTLTTDFSAGFSIAVWARPTATNTWARFVDLGAGQDVDNIVLCREGATSTLTAVIHDGSLVSRQAISATNAILNNAWHHYAVTVDSSGWAIVYVDGVEVASGTVGLPSSVTRNSNFIGRSNWVADQYYVGKMYDLYLYNRALCADEVLNLYKGGVAKGWRIIKWIEIK